MSTHVLARLFRVRSPRGVASPQPCPRQPPLTHPPPHCLPCLPVCFACRDATLIMQLIRDNLTLWTSDQAEGMPEDKDDEGADLERETPQ